MNLEVGNYYLNASGEIVKIESEHSGDYNFMDTNMRTYLINGRYRSYEQSKEDLIVEIPKELHWNLMYNIKNFHTNGNVRKKQKRKYNNYINCCVSKNKEIK